MSATSSGMQQPVRQNQQTQQPQQQPSTQSINQTNNPNTLNQMNHPSNYQISNQTSLNNPNQIMNQLPNTIGYPNYGPNMTMQQQQQQPYNPYYTSKQPTLTHFFKQGVNPTYNTTTTTAPSYISSILFIEFDTSGLLTLIKSHANSIFGIIVKSP